MPQRIALLCWDPIDSNLFGRGYSRKSGGAGETNCQISGDVRNVRIGRPPTVLWCFILERDFTFRSFLFLFFVSPSS